MNHLTVRKHQQESVQPNLFPIDIYAR